MKVSINFKEENICAKMTTEKVAILTKIDRERLYGIVISLFRAKLVDLNRIKLNLISVDDQASLLDF